MKRAEELETAKERKMFSLCFLPVPLFCGVIDRGGVAGAGHRRDIGDGSRLVVHRHRGGGEVQERERRGEARAVSSGDMTVTAKSTVRRQRKRKRG